VISLKKMTNITIKRMKVTELDPAPYNPRQISEASLAGLQASIHRFGLVEPIVWNERTRRVVGGHQRLKVLLAESVETTDVVVVDLPQTEEKALNVALNNPAIMGEFTEALIPLLEEINADLPELFGELRFDDLLDLVSGDWKLDGDEPPEDPGADLDLADEFQAKWQVEPGQIWTLGTHRILCGDAADPGVFEQLMRSQPATMSFTDPPYNVAYGESKHHPSWKIRSIQGDKQTPDEWEAFVRGFGDQLKMCCQGDVYVWGASGPDGMRMRLRLIEMGLHWSATIIWKKQQLVLSPAKYQRIHEPCLYGWFGTKSSYQGDRTQTDCWEVDRPYSSPEHPTMKPVELAEIAIGNSSGSGDIVLDLFLGSGTTLIACERLRRRCRAVEIEPKYVAVTLERWQRMTGKTPKPAEEVMVRPDTRVTA
jgi:DNA modification methylase